MNSQVAYQPSSAVEDLQFTVKRVVVELANGEEGVGTGYVFETRPNAEKVIRFLVVNAHLIEDANLAKFLLHVAVRNGEELRLNGTTVFVEVPLDERYVVYHPDSDIDLAAIIIGPAIKKWLESASAGVELYFKVLSADIIASEADLKSIKPTTAVTMVGCPEGLWDDIHGFPLFRRGTLASTPAINYQGRPEFAVDILVFSGSSGSPIFLTDRTDGILLLGTLWGSPRVGEAGEITNEDVPTSADVSAEDRGRTHIGLAIKADQLSALSAEVEREVLTRDGLSTKQNRD